MPRRLPSVHAPASRELSPLVARSPLRSCSWTTTDYSRQHWRVPDYSRQGGRARKSKPCPLFRARSFSPAHSLTCLLLLRHLDRVPGLILLLHHGGGLGLPLKPPKILVKKDDATAEGHVLVYVLDKLTEKSSLETRCVTVVFQAERWAAARSPSPPPPPPQQDGRSHRPSGLICPAQGSLTWQGRGSQR